MFLLALMTLLLQLLPMCSLNTITFLRTLPMQYAALKPLQTLQRQAAPVHMDIQAAMDAARQRDERCMQQLCNTQRNEQQAQQQLQEDEEEEEHHRWQQERELIKRQQRSEEVANNTSRQDLTVYEASNSQEPPVALIPSTPPHPPFQPIVVPPIHPIPPPPSPPVQLPLVKVNTARIAKSE